MESSSTDVSHLPKSNFRQFIVELAERSDVSHVRTHLDLWAESVTRMSGDEVETDEIDDLLIALKKQGVLSAHEMLYLLIGYMRETKNDSTS